MENMLIYFAKVNGLLILFYFVYVLFLRKETFFTSNRWYLVLGLLLSVVLPLLTFTKTVYIEPEPIVYATELPVLKPTFEPIVVEEAPFDWSLVFLVFYSAIATLFFIKILIEIGSFFKRIKNQNKQKVGKYTLVLSNSIENPFSFFSYIVINKNRFSEAELHHILTHESIHVKQKHSFDVLLSKLYCAVFWVNPIIWMYRKAMLQNLEFIADNETFRQIENKYEYQKTLVKVVSHQHNLSITNQFYQSLIKKRIVMLHTNQSHKKNVWKYATILPLLVGFMLFFQIETVAQVKEKAEIAAYGVSTSYASIVTKNSSDLELKGLEKTFSDENLKLSIRNVKRNKEGEIIQIKLEFDNGKTYNRVQEVKATTPIDPIEIFISTDKNDVKTFGFREPLNKNKLSAYLPDENTAFAIESDSISQEFWTLDNMVKEGKKVNLIVNGKLQTESQKVKIPNAEELDIVKELDAKQLKGKYNINKKDGEAYYEITTKKESNNPDSDAVYAVEVAAEYSEDENFSHIDKIKRDKLVDAKKALILLNGKEINYEDLDKIDEKTISSSGNTVASHAKKKYGLKGENGVIFINTKAQDTENNPFVIEYENKKQIELKAKENSSNSRERIEERKKMNEERKKRIEERKIKLEQRNEERKDIIEQKKE